MLHKLSWTETELAAAGWKFSNTNRCKCGVEIAVYEKFTPKRYLFLEEGTLEVHTCS